MNLTLAHVNVQGLAPCKEELALSGRVVYSSSGGRLVVPDAAKKADSIPLTVGRSQSYGSRNLPVSGRFTPLLRRAGTIWGRMTTEPAMELRLTVGTVLQSADPPMCHLDIQPSPMHSSQGL